MTKRIRKLLSIVMVTAIILSVLPWVSATETEHEHEWWVADSDPLGHDFMCVCGEYREAEHTFDDSGFCTVCGYENHIHDWYRTRANEELHVMNCSGCSETQEDAHIFDGGSCCTVCGYVKHEHTWQYIGNFDGGPHGMTCTQCDTIQWEEHIYGSDGTCTVCGVTAPHEHQWAWNGEINGDYYHGLSCDCGETMQEDHIWQWDGVTWGVQYHRIVCQVCGQSMDAFHQYFYPNTSGICYVCGYNTDTGSIESKPGDSEPEETESVETEPTETDPTEPMPEETEPEETDPSVTEPEETEPQKTEPEETVPENTEPAETEETKPAQTDPTASVDIPEKAGEATHRPGSFVWVCTAVLAVCVIGLAVFLWKNKKR